MLFCPEEYYWLSLLRGCFYHRLQLSKKEKGLTAQPFIYRSF
jgi:hypothetical protein